MATSAEKEIKINQCLNDLDDSLESGPEDDTAPPEEFLRNLAQKARSLLNAIEALTAADVDEIWLQEESEETE